MIRESRVQHLAWGAQALRQARSQAAAERCPLCALRWPLRRP